MRLFLAALSLSAAAVAEPLTLEQARAAVPRADLSDLTDLQRGMFVQVAGELFNYAGCSDTLAKCLAEGVKDPHAVRMASLVKQLIMDGFPPDKVIHGLEKYYASFSPGERQKLRSDNCPVYGKPKARVALVEFSDYQCPHCAAAVQPLHDLVAAEPDKARLCFKYFPFAIHARARIAAACAEYARAKGKFWELNGVLFKNQEALDDADLRGYAKQVGLDGDEMLKQAYAGKYDALIERHIREGTAAGVDHTPMIYFDGRPHILPMKPGYLAFSLADELEWQKAKGWRFDRIAPLAKSK